MSFIYDFIIIGAGLGGLSSGLLLQQKGAKVLLLESHTVSGGCASYFRRISKLEPVGNFNFDVGATTLSGFREDQPLYKFIKDTGIEHEVRKNLHKQSTGIVVHNLLKNEEKIYRYADENKWVNECINKFSDEQGMKKFWELIFKLERKSYKLIPSLKNFPPTNLLDYLSLPKNPKNLNLLYYLTQTVDDVLKKFSLENNLLFKKFLNEQLMITAQAHTEKVTFLPGCLALNYPAETYYINGGMYSFSKIMQDKFTELGGKILFKHKVDKIVKRNSDYNVVTNKEEYLAKKIISNIPIWNNENLFEDSKVRKYFRNLSAKNAEAWGAFTLYFGIEDKFNDYGSLYHQIHFKSNIAASGSVFVSISRSCDEEKAPPGWRTVTVSTHIANPEEWKDYTKEIYEQKKKILTDEILQLLENNFENFINCKKKYVLSGTPKTFEFYTKRKNGYVGGMPTTIKHNFFRQIPSKTPIEDFYLVGDTVFPGQGAPAVILGAVMLTSNL
ncbi:MAG: FAD-dependent oxidoreductase [Ignavibacteria bacterium]|nr:FAD-dependent oxidoreductase [Ignavibacteria bacterium]